MSAACHRCFTLPGFEPPSCGSITSPALGRFRAGDAVRFLREGRPLGSAGQQRVDASLP
jgi:hypothetical protein